MAERKHKPQRTRIAADRAEMLRKSKVQAGKPKASGSSKAAVITRQMQNKGVKEGTIRLGRGGKSYNVYDAKSGTWKRGVVVKKETPAKRPKSPSDFSSRNQYSAGGLGAGGTTGGSAKEYKNYRGRYVPYPRYSGKKK